MEFKDYHRLDIAKAEMQAWSCPGSNNEAFRVSLCHVKLKLHIGSFCIRIS